MPYSKRRRRRAPADPSGVAESPKSFLQTSAREVITEPMVDSGQAPIWALRMVRLAPGFYADRYGNVHISQAEVCAHFGVPATPENLATVVKAWNDTCRAQWGAAPKITEVKE